MNEEKPKRNCDCKRRMGISYFKYVVIDKHMGFEDHDETEFLPRFCPFCGQKLVLFEIEE